MSDNVPICTINVVVNYLKRKFSRDRFLDNYESEDDDDDDDFLNSRFFVTRCRVRGQRKDQNASPWAELLIDECIDDPNSNVGQLFRRRFRVPYSIFAYILQIIEVEG